MPTLALKDTFSFYQAVKLTAELKEYLDGKTAIETIIQILLHKFNLQGPASRLYFIRGRTGSGKSTLMISELYKALIPGTNQGLHVTEPRVVLDESNANDILRYHPEWSMGVEMTINNGSKKITSHQREVMCFCTPKILSNKLTKALQYENDNDAIRALSLYKIIVVDEVHVLDLSTMMLLKNIYDVVHRFGNNEQCPMFIFASATIDIPRMVEYYFPDSWKSELSNPFLVAEIAGASNYPVKDIFLTDGELAKMNQEEKAGDLFAGYNIMGKYIVRGVIGRVWESQSYIKHEGERVQCRDVLIFVASKMAIPRIGMCVQRAYGDKFPIMLIDENTVMDDLLAWRKRFRNQRRLLVIGYARGWSYVSEELLSHPIEQDPEARKFETHLIISTPIIETGKTITTLYVCIDTGLQNQTSYNPLVYDFNNDMPLRLMPLNINQAIQRLGRVGREAPGEFIHLYSENVMKQFELYDIPETINNYTLSGMILDNMKIASEYAVYDTMKTNNYIYPISNDIMIRSNIDLIRSGFMTMYGEYANLKSRIDSDELWMLYAEYLYYVKRVPLFHALMISAVYRYSLPAVETVSDIKTEHVIDNVLQIVNRGTGASADFIDGIKMARNKLTEIRHHHMSLAVYNRTFTYHKAVMFGKIPEHLYSKARQGNSQGFDKGFGKDNRGQSRFGDNGNRNDRGDHNRNDRDRRPHDRDRHGDGNNRRDDHNRDRHGDRDRRPHDRDRHGDRDRPHNRYSDSSQSSSSTSDNESPK